MVFDANKLGIKYLEILQAKRIEMEGSHIRRMKIVYISKLNGAKWSGPSYSVPAQIDAQSKIDDVIWINLGQEENSEWNKLDYYYNKRKISFKKISGLMKPFDKPDLVVVEQFYAFSTEKVFYNLIKEKVPYIIIPRGEFTEAAQAQKHVKKMVANRLFMNRYMKGACAIQYLTQKEKDDSKICKGYPGLVIPNGTQEKENIKQQFSPDELCFTYIGRIDVYHKGLDLLIQACNLVKMELIRNSVIIKIYGPDRDGRLDEMKNLVEKFGLTTVIRFLDAVVDPEKKKVLLDTDVFLMTSRFEGLPMALIEAMSYGIPCAITEGTNMRNEVREYDAGWDCQNSSESIADMFLKVIDEKKFLSQKGRNAHRLSKEYTWNSIAEKSQLEYEKIIRRE